MRWAEVAPKGFDASLTLVTWFDAMPPGSLQGLVIGTDNVHASYEELGAKGVPFDFAPRELPGGLQAVFRDPDGNGLVLAEGSGSLETPGSAARSPKPFDDTRW